MGRTVHVTIFNEFHHERNEQHPASKLYPNGMHSALADLLRVDEELQVTTATQDQPEHGLTAELLEATDVLLWWGHVHQHEVSDAVVDRVCRRVLDGMGFVPLHSSCLSKPFCRLLGTSGQIKWRESGDKERLWVIDHTHPIVAGLGEYVELAEVEMYGEPFDVPTPDDLIFISWFTGGEVFRSGCCWRRGRGRIFYFRPGHETFPIYFDPTVGRILRNACHWAAPDPEMPVPVFGHSQALE